MKILYFSQKPPFPKVDGGTGCAAGDIITLLRSGHTVHSFSLATPKHPAKRNGFSAVGYTSECGSVRPSLSAMALLQSIVRRGGYLAQRFWSPGIREQLKTCLRVFDPGLVVIQNVYLGRYLLPIHRTSKAPVILRVFDIEHDLWRQRCRRWPPPLRMIVTAFLQSWKTFEKKIWHQVDGVACLTVDMATQIGKVTGPQKVCVIPPLVEPESDRNIPSDSHLAFLGAMDWWPNQEGLDWFLSHVFPLVIQEVPDTKLYLAGRSLKKFIQSRCLPPEIICMGEVPDAGTFMLQHDFFIAPVCSGSGLRMKILEAMALGRVVIATDKAVEGFHCHPGRDILISRTPQDMASHIIRCRTTPLRVAHIPANALKCIRGQMAYPLIASEWEKLLRRQRG